MAVHDRLGQAGGARGEQDPQGMVEGDLLRADVVARGGDGIGPAGAGQVEPEDRDHDDRTQPGESGDQRRHLGPAVVGPAAVAVAVGGQEHRRSQLGEAVQRSGGTEVGGHTGPHGTDPGRSEHADDGVRPVGQVGGDAVTGADPDRSQVGGQGEHLPGQLRAGHLPQRGLLRHVHQRRPTRAEGPQHVFGEVEPGPGEPLRTGHAVVGQHGGGRLRRGDPEVLPDGAPEAGEVGRRPLPQRAVVREGPPGPLLDRTGEGGQVCGPGPVGRRGPQDVTLPDGVPIVCHVTHGENVLDTAAADNAGLPYTGRLSGNRPGIRPGSRAGRGPGRRRPWPPRHAGGAPHCPAEGCSGRR